MRSAPEFSFCGCGRPHPGGGSGDELTEIWPRRVGRAFGVVGQSGGWSTRPAATSGSTHSTMATHAGSPARTRGPGGPALAGRLCDPPGHHPGHPTARGGLPPSKPGLVAGTHDLACRVTSRRDLSEVSRPPAGGAELIASRGRRMDLCRSSDPGRSLGTHSFGGLVRPGADPLADPSTSARWTVRVKRVVPVHN